MTIDWQTIVVTVVALGAAAAVARRFIPKRRRPGAPGAAVACDHCEPAADVPTRTRTQTTPVISMSDLRKSGRRN